MKHVIITKVYIVWASSKGGKWLQEVYFSKEKAEQTIKALKEANPSFNFRTEEKATGDYLTWTEN